MSLYCLFFWVYWLTGFFLIHRVSARPFKGEHQGKSLSFLQSCTRINSVSLFLSVFCLYLRSCDIVVVTVINEQQPDALQRASMNSTAGCLHLPACLQEGVNPNGTGKGRSGHSISASPRHRWQALKKLYLLKCTFEKVDFHDVLLAGSFIPLFIVCAGC